MSKQVARLFENFRPEHYWLFLDLDPKKLTFSGEVKITGKKVGRPSERLTFHQKDLKILSASVTKIQKTGLEEIKLSRINTQASLDEVRLHSETMLYPGNYEISIKFAGPISKTMVGIYPCFFKNGGKDKHLLATQFESHHAREAFPCIDEPEAKATFELTLSAPYEGTAISNTPLVSKKVDKSKATWTFSKTPIMSSYLLAFVYGEIGHIETTTKSGVEVRAYATPDNVKFAGLGLEVAAKGLDFFSDYFKTPYPLAKLDIVALPDFSVGAMENWGLITFRETAMLADPKHSSIESKQIIAMVVGHELSHQWFGNLVTMKWWDDLWLNESFANLMEYRVVDELYPEWHIWELFVGNETGAAKRRDSIQDVQSVKTPVRHPDEIGGLFDPAIVYAKGGTLLHMLMHFIGEDAFTKGLKLYFDKYAYKNTSASDLWQELSTVSGQDIAGFMGNWLNKPGYPLVKVNYEPGESKFEATQTRFIANKTNNDLEDTIWQVPLASTLALDKSVLTKRSQPFTLKAPRLDEPLILNHEGTSYFLPLYENPAHLKQIISGIENGVVSDIDRLLLLDNYTMLQRGTLVDSVALIELLLGYKAESSQSVWGEIAMAFGEIRKLIEFDELSHTSLDKIVQKLDQAMFDRIGWDDSPDDSATTLRLRAIVVALMAGAKEPGVIKEGLKRFSKFKSPSDLTASTRSTIYSIAARHGSDEDFNRLVNLHNVLINADEKEEVAVSLTAAKDLKRLSKLIAMLKSDHIRRQDLIAWFIYLLRNRFSRPLAWQWLVDNWDWIEAEFGGDKRYSDFAKYPGSVFSNQSEYDQYVKFFTPMKDVVAMQRDIELALQEMTARIIWRTHNETSVKTWLKNHRS